MAVGRTLAPTAPGSASGFWVRLWLRVAVRGLVLVGAVFLAYEVVERSVFAGSTPGALHVLHIARGVGTALLLGTWSFLYTRSARLERDARLHDDMSALEARVIERTRELEEARAFTELLFNSLRERIIVVDASGRVVKANRVAELSAGAALVSHRCREVFASSARVGLSRTTRGGGAAGSAVEIRADGDGRVWELETIPIPGSAGSPAVVVEVGRDVTERRNLEAQVRHQEKMASLGTLAAGFAHDMGNPLASLSTELELLEGEEDAARVRESLGVLGRHVARMKRTLREMVEFARRRRDDVTDVSLASAVADSARLVCHDPRLQRVRIAIDVPTELPAVRLVEDHLVLVIVNLMLNAADAMPDGGTLTISARAHDELVDVRVRDTGTGMTPEVLAAATTPLFTTKSAGRGTGLGLAVSANVIRGLGGAMTLTSTPGLGTEVSITLPASRGADA